MPDEVLHIITNEQIPESPEELLLRGALGICKKANAEKYQLQKNNERLTAQLQSLSGGTVIADGKQKEMIAILNAIYETGMITCTKSEYMQRMGKALGAPTIENYSSSLHNIMTANKYDDIFNNLKETAKEAKNNMLEK